MFSAFPPKWLKTEKRKQKIDGANDKLKKH